MTDKNRNLYGSCGVKEASFTLADLIKAQEELLGIGTRSTKVTFNQEGFKYLKRLTWNNLNYKAAGDPPEHLFNGIPCFLQPDQEEFYKIHY